MWSSFYSNVDTERVVLTGIVGDNKVRDRQIDPLTDLHTPNEFYQILITDSTVSNGEFAFHYLTLK